MHLLYERKVGFLTRPQAELVLQVMTRIAADPNAMKALGLETRRARLMSRRIASILRKKIDRRDEKMRAKEAKRDAHEAGPTPVDDENADKPFEELGVDLGKWMKS